MTVIPVHVPVGDRHQQPTTIMQIMHTVMEVPATATVIVRVDVSDMLSFIA
jgi:hypothetical protein